MAKNIILNKTTRTNVKKNHSWMAGLKKTKAGVFSDTFWGKTEILLNTSGLRVYFGKDQGVF